MFSLDKELLKALQQVAERRGECVADTVRAALARQLPELKPGAVQ